MEIVVKISKNIEIGKAQEIARSIAEHLGDPMLLSFCDRRSGVKMPDVNCCGENSWEIYAKRRGGNLKVKVNEYEFIFRVE